MSWNILRRKSYKTQNPKVEKILLLEEWQECVNNDDELIWAENSPIAEIYSKEGEIWIREDRYKHDAYYEINKTDRG